jgi:hypothetical protein
MPVNPFSLFFILLIWPAPFYVPLVFLSYVIGRRQFYLKSLLGFITVECLAIGLCRYVVITRIPEQGAIEALAVSVSISLPIWIPSIGLAYSVGRDYFNPYYIFWLIMASFCSIFAGCGLAYVVVRL